MRSIAIIGSGQAGLLCAHALLGHGYRVTLYSDRTADQWLNESRATGTALRFDTALSFERELGLNYWENEAPKVEGLYATLCPDSGKRLLSLVGRFNSYALAIDLRLQSHRWLRELEAKGGQVEIETVTVGRLDQIANEHDLTIVATGRGELANLFERNQQDSVYDQPQRQLALIATVGGADRFDEVDYTAARVLIFPPHGEVFFVPYFHKDHGPSWNLLFEAKSGGPIDRFQEVSSGEEALAAAKQVVQEVAPWHADWCEEMELADEHGWLKGAFAPTVKHPVGHLPSGQVVTALGDTAIAYDPVGAQGANSGNKMARQLADAIVRHGDGEFDESWMKATFKDFFERDGRAMYSFNNMMLEPAPDSMKELLIAQVGSDGSSEARSGRQAIANDFCNNFDDPNLLEAALADVKSARRHIGKRTGKPWLVSALSGRLRVAAGQVLNRPG